MGVSKVNLNGKTLIDLTSDTVNEQVVLSGYSVHNCAGELINGSLVLPTLSLTEVFDGDSRNSHEIDITHIPDYQKYSVNDFVLKDVYVYATRGFKDENDRDNYIIDRYDAQNGVLYLNESWAWTIAANIRYTVACYYKVMLITLGK